MTKKKTADLRYSGPTGKEYDACEFAGSLAGLIGRLTDLKTNLEKEGWSDLQLQDEGGYDHVCFVVYGNRDKTPLELERERKEAVEYRATQLRTLQYFETKLDNLKKELADAPEL